ncbi:CD209 antigen-like protein E [Erpetoichthys calabaricus]|uniref:CD209 antigen-like protein E n=1 Tax=Erpetoichthys calabaricus TaxID=27687 RepID=A0A8C4SZ53_ERPCA|nr:CD209 antigen-like protein E [Erpetoichthys calabaricus]
MDNENLYKSLEKPTEDIYTALAQILDRKRNKGAKAHINRVKRDPSSPSHLEECRDTETVIRESPSKTIWKGILLKLLFFVCGALVATFIFLVLYYLTAFKQTYNNDKLQKNESFTKKELKQLQSQLEELQQRNNELLSKLEALDEQCPITNNYTQSRICSGCPAGWVLFNSKCYFFSTDKMDWYLSDADCNSLGGHLVIIESYEEQQFLKNEITKRGHGKSYWIGLTDCQTEGRFFWVDGSPLDSHKSFWDTDNNGGIQPDNWKNNGLSPKGEDCVHLQILPYSSGWHDGFCERQEKRICEAATQTITLNM